MAGRGLGRSVTVREKFKNDRGEPNDGIAPMSASGSGSRSARRLVDIIREEQERRGSGSGPGPEPIREAGNGTINWKAFRDRIRLLRAGYAFLPNSDNPNPAPNSVEEFNPNPIPVTNGEAGSGGGEPVMSLMALLEQTEGGGFGAFEDPDAGLDDEDEEEDDGGEGGEYACCVCMVRHKGAAFIPCGHTFCRLCSRELWVSRGNCPLCNGFILEILDIF